MSDKLFNYTFNLLQDKGYSGSIEDFAIEIKEDKLKNYTFELLKSKGYTGNLNDFVKELEPGKTSDVAKKGAVVTSDQQQAPIQIEDTDLQLVDGSLERVVEDDPDGGVVSLLDQYRENTKDDPEFYNVDSKLGQFLIDKVAAFASGTSSILGGAADIVEMGADVAASKAIDLYNYFADDENDFTQEERNKIAGNIEKAFALDDLLYIASEEAGKRMTKRDEELGEGISGAFQEGNYLEGLDRLLSGAFQAAPSVVAALTGYVGLGVIGASATAQHYEEKTENNAEDRGLAAMLVSLGQGGIELASEAVTRGLFKGSNILLPKNVQKQLAKSITGRLTGGMFTEAFSETASEELNNAIDLAFDIDKFSDENGNFDYNTVGARIMDTALISAVIGGTGTGTSLITEKGKAYQADRLMAPEQQGEIISLQKEIKKQEALNVGQNIKKRNEDIAALKARQKRFTENNKIVIDNLSKDQKLEMFKLIESNTDLEAANKNLNLTEQQKKSNKKLIKQNNDKWNSIYTSKLNELVEERKTKTIEFAKSAKGLGLDIKVEELKGKEFQDKVKNETNFLKSQEDSINKNKDLSAEEKKKQIEKLKKEEVRAGAFINPKTNEIFINVDKLQDLDQLNVGSHEVLHAILNNLVNSNAKQGQLVEEFKSNLSKNQKNIMEGLLRKRGYDSKEKYNSEYLTVFSDAILDGDIVYNDTLGSQLKAFFERLFKRIAPEATKNLSVKDGNQAFEFMKAYTESAKKGFITDEIAQVFDKTVETEKPKGTRRLINEEDWNKAGEDERTDFLLQAFKDPDDIEGLQFEEFKDLPDTATSNMYIDPNDVADIAEFSTAERESSEEVQRLFEEKPRDWEMKVIEKFRPITSKLVERRRGVQGFDRQLLMDEIETGKRGIYDLIQAYDPSRGVPLSAYINTQLKNRMQEVSERNLEKYYTTDVTEERGISAPEDAISIEETVDESITPTKQEKLNLRKKIKLPDEQVEKVRQAVRKTFGTKLPPPDSPKFKKALRKAFDTELFKELKTNVFKARKDYEFFMSQNWKALYDAIPQETLNQSFAPFREPVLDENGKQKREKTPEGERIFRKKNITKEEFLDYFFSPDLGVSTRGTRKDAIVRMMAQELGFDAIMETIQEPKVAEKTEFINPEITPQSIAPAVDRAIDAEFTQAANDFATEQNIDTNERKSKADLDRSIDGIVEILSQVGEDGMNVMPIGIVNQSVLAGGEINIKGKDRIKYTGKVKELIDKYDPTFEKAYEKGNVEAQRKLGKIKKLQDGEFIRGKDYLRARLFVEKKEGRLVDLLKTRVPGYSKTPPSRIFGSNLSVIAEKITKKAVDAYNSASGKMFDDFWLAIRKLASDEKYKDLRQKHGVELYYLLESSINERSHPHSVGARIIGYVMPKGTKYNNSTWEHAVPSKVAYQFLIEKAFDPEADFDAALKVVKRNYTLMAIPQLVDDAITATGLKDKMPPDWSFENPDNVWQERYLYNKLNEELKKSEFKNIKNFSFKNDTYIIPGTTNQKNPFDQDIQLSTAEKLDKRFNKIIENKTSIAASETISEAKARLAGEKNTKFRFFIPPSADDLMGLLYYTLGKGKIGDAQLKWYNENVISPFAQAMEAISRDRNETARRFNEIVKELGIIPKNLRKEIPGDIFTVEQAVRVYIWNKQGMKIPGLSQSDRTKLSKYIDNNPNLKKFGDKLINVNRGYDYAKPGEGWLTGTITSDLKETLNTTKRAAYLQQWQKNVDVIFSKENLNKLEAAFGREYRKALENVLKRMQTGRNRDFPGDKLTTRFVDWINGSVGAIMFFNTRSAILQTLSAVNFINFSDNNVFAAAKAFANQDQYWSDFKTLFNSDFLVDRRQGLRMDINEADLATAAKQGGTRGVISRLLKIGFTPTQIADSFAIAAGGSTFYRNRLNSLMKDGMDQKAAEKIAFQEFRETAEESQQSSRPDKISQQQAGPLGRIILAFANTPSQYARITKKAFLDLKNGRGDAKTNISKIVYYTFAQNLIFNAAQQALFAISFADNDEEEEKLKDKKIARIANGMADSVLRGLGFGGAIASTVKNIAIKLEQQSKKKNPEYQDAMLDIFKISPPISSKITKLKSAARAYDWNKEEMKTKGMSIDNPAALALGELTSALTNVPVDRAIRKVQNVNASITDDLDFYQRLALLGGWNKWDLGIQETKETLDKKGLKKGKRKVVNVKDLKVVTLNKNERNK